jgi:predicted site-specific integrase-resolvase
MSATESLFEDGGLNVNDAAKFAAVSRSLLYEWMEAGRLPYSTVSGRRIIPKRALQRLLASEMVGVETGAK